MLLLFMALLADGAGDYTKSFPRSYAAADVWYKCGIDGMGRLHPSAEATVSPSQIATEAMVGCQEQQHVLLAVATSELRPLFVDEVEAREKAENFLVLMAISVHDQLTAVASATQADVAAKHQ